MRDSERLPGGPEGAHPGQDGHHGRGPGAAAPWPAAGDGGRPGAAPGPAAGRPAGGGDPATQGAFLVDSFRALQAVRPGPGRLHSATHEEIRSGATTDVYFVKTYEVLRHLGALDTPVTADIFANRPGILCGVEEALQLLQGLPVAVWAVDEGLPVEAGQVVMRIQGPYGAFGLYETALLGMLASATGWATAARRIKDVAGDTPVICFGARHVHPAVAPVMERAALVGGMDGASCILGARLAGRDPAGTLPHAVMLIAGDTLVVAQAADRVFPPEERRVVLVDTFQDEALEAVRVAAALGRRLAAVRLDTPSERGGVTPGLVREVKARLAQAGFGHVQVIASGGITPERIPPLREAGADAFGVGSYVSAAPPVDMTMDIKEVAGRPVAKRGRIPGAAPDPRLRRRL
ncbi:nicotinate phosphoribosyltransferase [Thermaerobacter sp. PB12/4term]|uniref:nicotinate phosphoribosyltransferase n=1 Tax=Thermaerobacter sp. PB12/4term TaxID=2293838 RepID=UPI000E32A48F|nr:nicotinate phosphoribosyltransferase [Thermaerobacter sp. PB12/4term]QIA27059.1 nicotinate phosphoribosyltransferase [Thermaerobacter sp. PB12/4term]